MPTPMPAGLTLGAVEPKEAFAAFARRGLLKQGFRWQDVWASEHARAFTVAGVMRDDVLQIFQTEIETSLADGRSLIDFKERVTKQLTGKGFWGDVQVTDPATGETRISRFNDNRLKLIYDVNLRQSHAAGRWSRIERNKALFPLVLYRTAQDERVRASHAAWNGLALPVDDAFWQSHYPPNGWRCRCLAFATNEKDLQRRATAGQVIKRQAPEVRFVDYVNPHTDEVRAVPEGIDPGFGYNPGLAARGHMAHAAELQGESIAGLDAPIGAAVGQALPSQARQVLDDAYRQWLSAARGAQVDANIARQRPVVGTITPADSAWLSDNAAVGPLSAALRMSAQAIKAADAAQAELLADMLPSLPDVLRMPRAVVYDEAKRELVYVLPDSANPAQVVLVRVRLDTRATGRGNVVQQLQRVALTDVLGQLASAALQLVRGALA